MRNLRCGSRTPAESCSAKLLRPSSACGQLPRAVSVRLREIRGTSNTLRVAPAAEVAAAVAAGLHPVAQGSDGGGSVRIPAACCGLVGIKPSRGRITRAPSEGESWGGLSTTGPIARTVRDAALMLDAMSGMMPGDPYAARPPLRPFVEEISAHPKKLRLAMINRSALGTVEPETLAALESACGVFREMGHSVEPIALDPGAMLGKYARVIVGASVSALNIPNPDLLDPVARGSYEWGAKISAADYIRAVTGMHNTSREIIHALMPYDALLAPTLTRPAVRIGTLAVEPRHWRRRNLRMDRVYVPVQLDRPAGDFDPQRIQQSRIAARASNRRTPR